MKEYKKGTKFTICSRDELIGKGWHETYKTKGGIDPLHHDDFPGDSINNDMLSQKERVLTVDFPLSNKDGWYTVLENNFNWPVATFLELNVADLINCHVCIEGMTPIDGWFICKNCGTNLKEVK